MTLYTISTNNPVNRTNLTFKIKDIHGMLPFEESYEMLRKTENGVINPRAAGNPFDYLRVMQPQFKSAIDLIVEFWRDFSNSNIRNLYNYLGNRYIAKLKRCAAEKHCC